ncbi:hypothetical protein [Rhizobium sp. RU33A]|uniref:hypothetical protein n=1 Tax=Rhizobium sp. RU33A TaxID=1907413 RepID=UPI001588A84D|nr:hypothetical protein [Rhizobium sp. RU33A]
MSATVAFSRKLVVGSLDAPADWDQDPKRLSAGRHYVSDGRFAEKEQAVSLAMVNPARNRTRFWWQALHPGHRLAQDGGPRRSELPRSLMPQQDRKITVS